MMLRKIFKNRGFFINMLACTSFLCLAVFGWGMPVEDLVRYFFIVVGCLVVVIGLALLAGYLLRKMLRDD
jgi:hypothetical protein